jgi:hypothetical protein
MAGMRAVGVSVVSMPTVFRHFVALSVASQTDGLWRSPASADAELLDPRRLAG